MGGQYAGTAEGGDRKEGLFLRGGGWGRGCEVWSKKGTEIWRTWAKKCSKRFSGTTGGGKKFLWKKEYKQDWSVYRGLWEVLARGEKRQRDGQNRRFGTRVESGRAVKPKPWAHSGGVLQRPSESAAWPERGRLQKIQ